MNLATLGLDPAPLFWALVGATIGMSLAAATTRRRAAVIFACVVLVCSLFGAYLAVRYAEGDPLSRNAFACGLAIFFHPLLNAAVTHFPSAINGLLRRMGLDGTTP